MSVAIVTGAAGLIGSETVRFYARQGLDVVGIDNDMRRVFFGDAASTAWSKRELQREVPGYRHHDVDIRDRQALDKIFAAAGRAVTTVIHTAAQPSHDWAATDPRTDFTVNANGTLELLEATRRHCPDAVFIFTSTNKVYGDTPNDLPLEEHTTRFELPPSHPWGTHGIDENMSLDRSTHSLFGVSKVAADLLVQEYGRYFGLRTGVFRGGCLTGPRHSGAQLHGFLAWLVKCAVAGERYTVFGYQGKQVRDNIHAHDLVSAFWSFGLDPRPGEVYNIGGGRHANCSVREAIALVEGLAGKPFDWVHDERHRVGDHKWWISDVRKFRSHYPAWDYRYDLPAMLNAIWEGVSERLRTSHRRPRSVEVRRTARPIAERRGRAEATALED